MNIEELLVIARELVNRQKFCFAITVAARGEANARIVQPHRLTQDWSVDFATRRTCREFTEIESSGKLTLAYHDDTERAYVSHVGSVTVEADIELKRSRYSVLTIDQKELAKRWNPKGHDDPGWLYIRLVASRIKLWSGECNVMPEPVDCSAAI